MKQKALIPIRFFLLIYLSTLFLKVMVAGEQKAASDWHAEDIPFRVLNLTTPEIGSICFGAVSQIRILINSRSEQ